MGTWHRGFQQRSGRSGPVARSQRLASHSQSRPYYQQFAINGPRCAMSIRAFSFFASNSKAPNWLSVVRISPFLSTAQLHDPLPKNKPRPGYLSGSLSFTSGLQHFSIKNDDEWTVIFPVGACCGRGSEAGAQCARPIQVR